MRVVLDCNVLLVSIARKSRYRPIFEFIQRGWISLIVSNEILFEYQEVVGTKTSQDIANNVVDMILALPLTIKSEPNFRLNLIEADPDDNKYVDAAISSVADYIVTNDAHFNVLKQIDFPKIDILTADEFLSLLTQDKLLP
jgi:putative PIN family toxin of toxin-antitoxin system